MHPTRLLATLISATILSPAAVAGNSFFIAQTGNNHVAAVTQQGSNVAGIDQNGNSLSVSGFQMGQNNRYAVIQRESNNSGHTVTAGRDNNVSVRQSGTQNIANSIVEGTGNATVQAQLYQPTLNSPVKQPTRTLSNIHVTGSYNELTTEQYGPDHVTHYRQDGDAQYGRTVQAGERHLIHAHQQGAAQRMEIFQTGDSNRTDAVQIGVGSRLHNVQQGGRNTTSTTVIGDGNNISQNQDGDDNYIINRVTGSHNTLRQAQETHAQWNSPMNHAVRNTSYATVAGSGNYLVTGQYGPDNAVSYTQLGDNNTGNTQQIGDPQVLTIHQQGVGQTLSSTQIGYDNRANIRQVGLYNDLTSYQQGTNNRADVTADGDFLTVRLRQDYLDGWNSAMNYARDNYAYIYTNGIRNTAIVSQHGPANNAYLTQEGVHNHAVLEQIGDPQTLHVIQWEEAYSNVDARQTGYDNYGVVDQRGIGSGIGVGNTTNTKQHGFNNWFNAYTKGSHNVVNVRQDGNVWNDVGHHNWANVNVTGNANGVGLHQVLQYNAADIRITGDGNNFTLGQERNPAMGATQGNHATANVTGSANYFYGYQWGANDFSIHQVGNFNAALMEQKNNGNWADRNTGVISQSGNNNAAQLFQVAVPYTVVPNQAPGQGPVNRDVAIIDQRGDGNNAVSWQSSSDSYSRILQVGNANTYYGTQSGAHNVLNIEQHGNGLAFAVAQSGVGQNMTIAQYR